MEEVFQFFFALVLLAGAVWVASTPIVSIFKHEFEWEDVGMFLVAIFGAVMLGLGGIGCMRSLFS